MEPHDGAQLAEHATIPGPLQHAAAVPVTIEKALDTVTVFLVSFFSKMFFINNCFCSLDSNPQA